VCDAFGTLRSGGARLSVASSADQTFDASRDVGIELSAAVDCVRLRQPIASTMSATASSV
jgi:hypothetical protein